MDGKIKARPPVRRMGLVGLKIFGIRHIQPAGAFVTNTNDFNAATAIPVNANAHSAMTARDDDFDPRPGRIRHGNQGAKRQKSFLSEVAKKAGHRGQTFGRSGGTTGRSTFGRGRRAALSLTSRSSSRRVVVMARIVRHRGGHFRSAPLSKHIAYLKRDGVTRDGADARMFDAASDDADAKAFAERCEADRHHFRFTVSPEDAVEMADLRAFTRELMKDAERDLGTSLEWVAVDHWNTDNPHVHVLVRGRAHDGRTWSSAANTSVGAFAAGRRNGLHWSWDLAARRKSTPGWKTRSTPAAGQVSIDRSETSRMKVEESSTYVRTAPARIPSCAG
jgi:hypothetical protein